MLYLLRCALSKGSLACTGLAALCQLHLHLMQNSPDFSGKVIVVITIIIITIVTIIVIVIIINAKLN